MIFDILQQGYLAKHWQFDVDPGPETCAQVGWAGQDVTQVLVPHELPASLLNEMLHLTGNQARSKVFYKIIAERRFDVID